MRSGWTRAVLFGVVLACTLWLLARDNRTARSARGDPPSNLQPSGSGPDGGGATPSAAPSASLTAALASALEGTDPHVAEDSAAALRRRLRLDAEARRRVEEMLLAKETPRELRMALALVLGTLGGSDATLLEALGLFRDDADVMRCLLFALGATRDPPDDDEVFGLGDRPWGVHGPKGLGITVRRSVEDGSVRESLARHLGDSRGPVREAAAVSLRHSTAVAHVRSEFLTALHVERDDDVALVLGEAMAVWAGGAREDAEQIEVVRVLLSRVGDPGLDGFRFRMEDDFRRIKLSSTHQATLAEYAQPARPYEVRSFALSALASAAAEAARPMLDDFLAGDRDPAIRDLSARLLGTLPKDDGSIAALVTASRGDTAWNVRYQSVDALGRFRADQKAAAAIRAAVTDADARVAKLARALAAR